MHWFNVAWHWFEVKSGTANESGPYYAFWSGAGSDIGELAIIGALIGGYRKVNCHVKRCPRFSHHEYEMDGVRYKLCRKHHPNAEVKSAEDFVKHRRASRVKRDAKGRFV